MYQAKELINSAIKKLNVKSFKRTGHVKGRTKSEKIIQLYQHPYTEEEIAKLLYPKGKDQNFRKLKSRMIEKSAASILSQIDKVKFRNLYDKNVFTVQKLFLVSNLLIVKDNREIANSLLKKALRIAISIQLTPYIIQIAKQLCYALAYSGKIKESEAYTRLVKEKLVIYSNELEIELEYYLLIAHITDNAEYTSPIKNELKTLFIKIKSVIRKNQSHTLQILFYRIGIRYFHSIHDFENMILLSKSAMKYLDKNPDLMQNARAGEFALNEMDACLRLQKYADGTQCANRCVKYFVPYTSMWSVFYEYYFLLAMRTSNYKKAKEIYNTITESNYKLNKMLVRQKDKWKIYEAYLSFATDDSTSSKQFNLFKYLNDFDLLNRDKKGFNFIVIISKFLLLLDIRNNDALLQMEDSFRVYFRRYIKSAEFPRHYLFGKFISDLFKNNFELDKIDIQVLISRFESFSIIEETEVIPYEKLVRIIVSKIKY